MMPRIFLPSLPSLPSIWSSLLWMTLCVVVMERCSAAFMEGTANSDRGFAFIARFCFDFDPDLNPAGHFTLSVQDHLPLSSKTLQWAIYDDEAMSWPLVLENKGVWTCQQLIANDVNRTGPAFGKGEFTGDSVDGGWKTSGIVPVYQKLRPRFWFLALDDCTNMNIADVQYRVHFVNSLQSSWSEEFGSNERGLNTLYLIFSVCYTLLISLHLYGVAQLRREIGFVHPILKVFTAALLLEYLAVLFFAGHYLSFGVNGVGAVWLTYLGQSLAAVSRMLFLLMLLFLAHGWTISRDKVYSPYVTALVVASFLALQIALLAYEWISYDPELTSVTRVDLVLQLAVIACYLTFGIYFMVVIFGVSFREETLPAKKTLYARLGTLFSLWMLGPSLIAIGVLLLDDWVRLKIVSSFTLTLTGIAYAILVFLFWPSRAQHYFRIHVDTQGVELSDFGTNDLLVTNSDEVSSNAYRAL